MNWPFLPFRSLWTCSKCKDKGWFFDHNGPGFYISESERPLLGTDPETGLPINGIRTRAFFCSCKVGQRAMKEIDNGKHPYYSRETEFLERISGSGMGPPDDG